MSNTFVNNYKYHIFKRSHTHACTHMCVHTHTHMHTHTHTNTHIHTHTHSHTDTHRHRYTHTNADTHTQYVSLCVNQHAIINFCIIAMIHCTKNKGQASLSPMLEGEGSIPAWDVGISPVYRLAGRLSAGVGGGRGGCCSLSLPQVRSSK